MDEEGGTHQIGDVDTQARILDAIRKEKSGTYIEDLARKLTLNRGTVKLYVGRLEEARKVRIEKKGNLKLILATH